MELLNQLGCFSLDKFKSFYLFRYISCSFMPDFSSSPTRLLAINKSDCFAIMKLLWNRKNTVSMYAQSEMKGFASAKERN